ncbi:MAG TPA: hypothetical protein VNZ26_11800 [Vicinamibacterales bacterium]|nr:hypothetical protein [Vicinamibacterales bacterium]
MPRLLLELPVLTTGAKQQHVANAARSLNEGGMEVMDGMDDNRLTD